MLRFVIGLESRATMRKRLFAVSIAAAIAIAAAARAAEPVSASDPLTSTVLSRLAESETPACIVVGYVAERTRTSFGCTRDAGPATLAGDSIFEIGSVTKGFTGILLADMVLKGEVSLDDPVAKYSRPGARLPTRGGREITLRDLVTQRSGLPRQPPGFRGADPRNPYAAFDADALYEALARTELTRDIGAAFEYSNFGFMWLSEALSRRGGKPYDALVAERVLVPLGMTDTAVVLSEEQRKRLVTGHTPDYRPTSPWDIPVALAGVGGLRSTMDDMLKLAEALAGRRETPIDPAIALALTPLARISEKSSIGFAWVINERSGTTVQWHNGGTGGFRSTVAVNRAAKKAAVVLVDSATSFDDLGLHLVDPDVALKKKRLAVTLARERLAEYPGTYELTPQFAITVFLDGDRLMAQATNQPAFEIFAAGGDRFFYRAVEAELVFGRNAAGRVDSVTLIQAGREIPGRRLE
jgi:D-alanyl-D-alanine-carboxypeptidase/D-alanyl-D-alanine-endopeptidase